MSDTTLSQQPATEESVEAIAPKADAPETFAEPPVASPSVGAFIETNAEDPEETTPLEAAEQRFMKTPKKSSAKKPAKASAKPTTAQAVDALVTTITSMAESVSALSNTVESMSEKIVTPPAPVTVEVAPISVADAPAEEEAKPKKNSLLSVALQSVGSLASFVGVGLVAAAAMRASFDSSAIIMGIVGIAIYVGNSVAIERGDQVKGVKDVAINAAMAVVAVVALGLLVGGIQRFGDDSHRAAILIPAGAALFLVASAWKMRDRLASEHLVWMAGTGVWICLFLALALGVVANKIDPKPADSEPASTQPATGGHDAKPAATDGHATEPTESEHSTATTVAESHGTDGHATETTAAPEGHHATTTDSHATTDKKSTANEHSAADSHAPPTAAPANSDALKQALEAANKAESGSGH